MNKKIAGILSAVLMLTMMGCASRDGMTAGQQGAETSAGQQGVETSAVETVSAETAQAETAAAESEAEGGGEAYGSNDITVLFTNDVHCGVSENIGYDGLSAYKKEMESKGGSVFLVDDGDELQGGTIGTLTKGDAIINIMNDVGYDVAAPGNHDFDYGLDRYMELAKKADFDYVCSNITDLRTGELLFPPYVIKEAGGKKIGFVGVTTPLTPTTSTPTFFQDSNGEYIYGFCQGSDGSKLYEAVQGAVDKAKAEGADYIVLLAHLGIEDEVTPYKSTDVIKNTTGIDAVLDGHSHSIVEMEKVRNKEGHDVLLSQTGTKLAAIGKLTIDSAGNMRTELITDYEKKDVEVTKAIAAEYEVFEDKLNEVISTADFDLRINTEDGKTRLVRNNETNLGDFVADAYKYVTDAEIAISCGGSVRHNIDAGDITYSDILNVNPFSNYMLKRKISGNELLDVLEYSVHAAPSEFGGFLQVSGLTFDVDLSVPTPVLTDLEGTFIGFEGEQRRVSNVKVNGEPLLPDRIYEVGGVSYTLKDGGDGYAMFTGEEVDIGRYIEDVDAIVEYLRSKDGKVPEEYAEQEGQERINFVEPASR